MDDRVDRKLMMSLEDRDISEKRMGKDSQEDPNLIIRAHVSVPILESRMNF